MKFRLGLLALCLGFVAHTFGESAVASPPAKAAAAKKHVAQYRVAKRVFQAAERLPNGQVRRAGVVQVQVHASRKLHDVRAEVLDLKGDGSALELRLDDSTDNVQATFAFRPEAGTGSISVGGKSVRIAFNPDGSYSVNDQVFKDLAKAAQAAQRNPALASLSAETYAAAAASMSESTQTKDVVGAACDIAGLFLEPMIESAISEAGCYLDGWVWEWYCI